MKSDSGTSSTLTWIDYVIFAAVLVTSLGIGLYQARKRQHTTSEYLMGDRKLHFFPTALSLLVSFVSVITIVGSGPELHYYGVTFVFVALGKMTSFIVTSLLIVPLMHPLQLVSINEVSLLINSEAHASCWRVCNQTDHQFSGFTSLWSTFCVRNVYYRKWWMESVPHCVSVDILNVLHNFCPPPLPVMLPPSAIFYILDILWVSDMTDEDLGPQVFQTTMLLIGK